MAAAVSESGGNGLMALIRRKRRSRFSAISLEQSLTI